MGAMRPWHWIMVLLVIIIVFGASRLPSIAKNVGQSAKILKKEMHELTEDEEPRLKSENPVQAEPDTLPSPSQQPGSDSSNAS
ncbi:MAG: twin-arginine translocase TatA/TatE family subunit [Actinomycetaceae bacterium]|nr:twin-arginine translocase TatA/TatE family subunit [Actinomycetaceae bacterium]